MGLRAMVVTVVGTFYVSPQILAAPPVSWTLCGCCIQARPLANSEPGEVAITIHSLIHLATSCRDYFKSQMVTFQPLSMNLLYSTYYQAGCAHLIPS